MARKGRGREGERSFRPRESDLPQGILRAKQRTLKQGEAKIFQGSDSGDRKGREKERS